MIRLSVWINNKTGGPEGYSLCARLYEAELEGSKPARVIRKIIDQIVFWEDEPHCRACWLWRN